MSRQVLLVFAGTLLLTSCSDTMMEPDERAVPESDASFGSGFVLREGVPFAVTFEIRDGRAIFEGDIDLGPASGVARTAEELRRAPRPGGPSLGVVTSDLGRRWPGGRIPYVIESSFPNQQRVHDAIAHMQGTAAGIAFVPRQSWDSNYIIFRRTTDPDICGQSAVGRAGGGQVLLVRDDCGVSTVIHELGHALGFWHEQSRCDRDSYIEVLWHNIRPEQKYRDQFTKFCGGGKMDLESYDETSVMHYHRWAYTANGQPTMRSLRGLDDLIGTGTWLSTQDTYTLNRMYRPFGPSGVAVAYPGGTPLISWNASNGASGYGVNMVRTYDEWNDYENTHVTWDEHQHGVGSTASLSISDPQSAYTGSNQCILYSSMYMTTSYSYWYDVTPYFPNGVVGSTTRWPAMIAPSSC